MQLLLSGLQLLLCGAFVCEAGVQLSDDQLAALAFLLGCCGALVGQLGVALGELYALLLDEYQGSKRAEQYQAKDGLAGSVHAAACSPPSSRCRA